MFVRLDRLKLDQQGAGQLTSELGRALSHATTTRWKRHALRGGSPRSVNFFL